MRALVVRDSRDVQLGDQLLLSDGHELAPAKVTSWARGVSGQIWIEADGVRLIFRIGELIPVLVEATPQ